MKIQVLGGHGGQAKGFATTSFLIDDKLLIDAGCVTTALSISEQSKIDNILISHSHLDHIKDLAFICDNCFGLRKEPFEVYTHATVKQAIKDHLFNEKIWPDFTQLPTEKNPTMRINAIEPEKTFLLDGFEITPVPVTHPNNAMGFIISNSKSTVLFTADTGPTERIWEMAAKLKNLKAIFTEVSFPNHLQKVADISDHHTPKTMKLEMAKMPKDIPIVLTHLKPNYRQEIMAEIVGWNDARIKVLEKDGEVFNF